MHTIKYFDCNATYGPYPEKHPRARWTLEQLCEDLSTAGISGALVHHQQAIHYDPMEGNMRLLKEINPYRNFLFPCWIALPSIGGDFPDETVFFNTLKDHGVKAIRIEPSAFNLPVWESVWRKMSKSAEKENLLTIISRNGFGGDYNEIRNFLKIFSGVPVLLLDHYWHEWRKVSALMQECNNLHIEFSSFQANRAVEEFAGRFGISRCLFGTNLPFKAAGAARGFFDWTLLSRSDAQTAAGDNLARLLGMKMSALSGLCRIPADNIAAAVNKGEPVPGGAIDGHGHLLHSLGNTGGKCHTMIKGDAKGVIELNKKIGITKMMIAPWAGALSRDDRRGNEIASDACKEFPDAFLGIFTVNAEYHTEAEALEICRRYYELGFAGAKPFHAKGVMYDNPVYHVIYAFLEAHRMHLWADVSDLTQSTAGREAITKIARTYPHLPIQLDHCGKSWEYAETAAEIIKSNPNIYAQLNYTLVTNGVIEFLTGEIGAEKLCFGTDAPMRDPRPQAAWVAYTRINEIDKIKIFNQNLDAILNRPSPEKIK